MDRRMASANAWKCALITIVPLLLISSSTAFTSENFVAAVYEHPRQGDWSYKPSSEIIRSNLEYYENATIVAKEYGADIILFPEYGIFPHDNRRKLKRYLEVIPNPKDVQVTPCDEAEEFSDRPILHSLSCMAKMNQIVVVANMGGIEYCNTEPNCSDDGTLHLNTNVVFDQNGTLLSRYYKPRLFIEIGMDLPREKQDPVFKTNFGKFAMFICFDIIFKEMADVSQSKDIDAVFFSALWMNSSPFYVSTQWWQAWAMGNNATLLVANLQLPGYSVTGSGIYKGREGSIASTLNPDGVPKLVIATISKKNDKMLPKSNVIAFTKNGIKEWKNDGEDVTSNCSYKSMGKTPDIHKTYRCFHENVSNYTLVKLNKTEDHLKVCSNAMCCELQYIANRMNETFYFGVYNGTNIPYMKYPWAEENCFLARCNDHQNEVCSEFPMISNTLFHRLNLAANFTAKHIYPSLLGSKIQLVPVKDWTFQTEGDKASIDFSSISGIQLLTAGLKGRAYDRDPPYER